MNTSNDLGDFQSFYESLELKLPSNKTKGKRNRMISRFTAENT